MPASERVMRFEIARELLRPPDRPSLADVAAQAAYLALWKMMPSTCRSPAWTVLTPWRIWTRW